MRIEYVCPVHLHARKTCTYRCLAKRREFSKICHDFRMYWYDRRRGVVGYTVTDWRIRYGRLP